MYACPRTRTREDTFRMITNGTAYLTPFSADTDAVIGKIEMTSYVAQQYGLVTSPVVGDLFNNALAQYATAHQDDFMVNDQREATTIFGATLLGDSAIALPGREPVTAGDFTRPQVTDTSLRAATVVTGYSPQSQYNSQNMPVNVIPHYTPGNNTGAVVTLQIQTSAPFVRVRVFTPFNHNTSYVPGEWVAAQLHDRHRGRPGYGGDVRRHERVDLRDCGGRRYSHVQRPDAVGLFRRRPGPEPRLDRRGPD